MKLIKIKLFHYIVLVSSLILSLINYSIEFQLKNLDKSNLSKDNSILTNMFTFEKRKKKHRIRQKNNTIDNKNNLSNKPSQPNNNKNNAPLNKNNAVNNTNSISSINNNINIPTINSTLNKVLDSSYSSQNLNGFVKDYSSWDLKMLTKDLHNIFDTMRLYDNKYKTPHGDRVYINLFVNDFTKCDKDKSNTLDYKEFKECMENDSYFKFIIAPIEMYASRKNLTNKDNFYNDIFSILDNQNSTYINFHGYMHLRFISFAWKKCGVQSPFIEEVNWECAIETLTSMKTSSRTTLRNIYYMAMELVGGDHVRNLDFISFLYFAQGVITYSKINGKMDSDVTKNEFNLALDENVLPKRYNQHLVDVFYRLTEDSSNLNGGIDIRTFIYYDFIFRLFDKYSLTRPYHLNYKEFELLLKDEVFPIKIKNEIAKINDKVFSKDSYNMYTYMNIDNFHEDKDFFNNFLEKSVITNKNNNYNRYRKIAAVHKAAEAALAGKKQYIYQNDIMSSPLPASKPLNFTSMLFKLFDLIDVNSDGYIDYYDFGTFYQTAYLFSKFDVKDSGQIMIPDAFEKYHYWSEFPRVSEEYRNRANRFNLINQDSYLDLYYVLLIMRIDDLAAMYTRKNDLSTMYEFELKRMFSKCSMNNVQDSKLKNCVKGLDRNNIPKYDWECSFIEGLKQNIDYIETATAYNTVKAQNITLVNTVFNNIDPALLSNSPANKNLTVPILQSKSSSGLKTNASSSNASNPTPKKARFF